MKHLFIICPNNSGSTLLKKYFIKCENVLHFPPDIEAQHTVMGKFMPEDTLVYRPWTEHLETYTNDKNYDWPAIHTEWMKQLLRSKKDGQDLDKAVCVYKSPPDIARLQMIRREFKNAFFLGMTRNPYAASEGYRRRHGIDIARCARHFGRCMELMKHHADHHRGIIFYSYEEFCENPNELAFDLVKFFGLPELHDLSFEETVTCHTLDSYKDSKGIRNLNDRQIANLSKEDIDIISRELQNYKNEMKYFGYEFLS